MTSGILVVLISLLIFLIAALPLRNWLEIRNCLYKIRKWDTWLTEKPSKNEYLAKIYSDGNTISCDYCGNSRQFEELEMVLIANPNFGFINNSHAKYLYYKRFICSGCGTELYRAKYEN